jgi:hypothetical protein
MVCCTPRHPRLARSSTAHTSERQDRSLGSRPTRGGGLPRSGLTGDGPSPHGILPRRRATQGGCREDLDHDRSADSAA